MRSLKGAWIQQVMIVWGDSINDVNLPIVEQLIEYFGLMIVILRKDQLGSVAFANE